MSQQLPNTLPDGRYPIDLMQGCDGDAHSSVTKLVVGVYDNQVSESAVRE